jgi:hypothetical protein
LCETLQRCLRGLLNVTRRLIRRPAKSIPRRDVTSGSFLRYIYPRKFLTAVQSFIAVRVAFLPLSGFRNPLPRHGKPADDKRAMKRFEVHLIGEEKWKEVLAESFTITDTDPMEIHFQGSKPHVVYYMHALRQPVTEVSAKPVPVLAQRP